MKVLIFSILALLGSIYFYSTLDPDDVFSHVFIKTMDTMVLLDSTFKYFNYPGFYRGYEDLISNFVFNKLNTTGLKVERTEFDGVEVYTFDPATREPNGAAIFFIHGGGWTYFQPKLFSHFTSAVARRLNMFVVSINYRRAPEHPFPTPANDAVAAAKYFFKNAEKFQVDPTRIALMGDSAGGNLAVVVAYQLALIKETDKNARVPKIIVPMVGAFQMADTMTPTMRAPDRDLLLCKRAIYWCYCTYAFGDIPSKDMEVCIEALSTNNHINEETYEKIKDNINWKEYLRGGDYETIQKSSFSFTPNPFQKRFSELILDPMYSPASALNNSELARLPPVYLLVAGLDPLLDDSRFFAARLAKIDRLRGYAEYNHYHDSFLLTPFGSQKSQDSINKLFKFFEGNIL